MSKENINFNAIKEYRVSAGIDSDGKVIDVRCVDYFYSKVRAMYAECLGLINLIVPPYISSLSCENNKLTELHLHEGLETLGCSGNQLFFKAFPDSLVNLIAGPEQFDYDTCKINNVDIYYVDIEI